MRDSTHCSLTNMAFRGFRLLRRCVDASVVRPVEYVGFVQEWRTFKRHTRRAGDARFSLSAVNLLPYLDDRTASTGFDRHYVYHPAWAARKLATLHPVEHIDIGSTLHFCTQVSAFLPVRFYDYRPAELNLSGLTSGRADLLALPFADASVESMSCMHTVEHVGLGRYGDALDPQGDLKAMKELMRVLAPGGHLLFVVPVGRPRLVFNAHRIYSYGQIVDAFSALALEEFSLIPDEGPMVENADPGLVESQDMGCGCFLFTR